MIEYYHISDPKKLRKCTPEQWISIRRSVAGFIKVRDIEDDVVGSSSVEIVTKEQEIAAVYEMDVKQLKASCAKYKLDDTGIEDDLVLRLVSHLEGGSGEEE